MKRASCVCREIRVVPMKTVTVNYFRISYLGGGGILLSIFPFQLFVQNTTEAEKADFLAELSLQCPQLQGHAGLEQSPDPMHCYPEGRSDCCCSEPGPSRGCPSAAHGTCALQGVPELLSLHQPPV